MTTTTWGDTVKTISIALGLMVVLFSGSAQAAGADEATCRAAIKSKTACAGTRNGSPQRTACVEAALQRCKAKGPGAI